MSFLTVSSQDNADYENWFAGGPVQQTTMPEIHVEVIQPPPDNSLLIATGIVVPVIIAIFGWWLTHRKKEHPNAGHAVSPNSYAKTDAEK